MEIARQFYFLRPKTFHIRFTRGHDIDNSNPLANMIAIAQYDRLLLINPLFRSFCCEIDIFCAYVTPIIRNILYTTRRRRRRISVGGTFSRNLNFKRICLVDFALRMNRSTTYLKRSIVFGSKDVGIDG